ncbi:MAG: hypothetical protein K2V38_21800 [Gemmataceae bacterium]|nr:hypothetical protein [Gemmataceae bacterium]
MTPDTARNPANQPSIEALTMRFLANRSDAMTAVEHGESEVEPHEVAAGFRVDARSAWLDATSGLTAPAPTAPPTEWAALVAQPSAAFALPMAAGHFPQRVKDLQPLLAKFNPQELRPSGSSSPLPALAGLRAWISKNGPTHPLVAAGIAGTLGDFDTAETLLKSAPGDDNARASLLWQRGKCAEALTVWEGLAESPAVLFNRGMAKLFLGNTAGARDALQKAIDLIPETSGWNALARLYLAVAEING